MLKQQVKTQVKKRANNKVNDIALVELSSGKKINGRSIFDPKLNLSAKTLKRIKAGAEKHFATAKPVPFFYASPECVHHSIKD